MFNKLKRYSKNTLLETLLLKLAGTMALFTIAMLFINALVLSFNGYSLGHGLLALYSLYVIPLEDSGASLSVIQGLLAAAFNVFAGYKGLNLIEAGLQKLEDNLDAKAQKRDSVLFDLETPSVLAKDKALINNHLRDVAARNSKEGKLKRAIQKKKHSDFVHDKDWGFNRY